MINQDYAPFELAKMLSKAGFPQFDEHNLMYYYSDSGEKAHIRYFTLGAKFYNCACPTLYQVQKWLRTEKNIEIFVIPEVRQYDKSKIYCCRIVTGISKNGFEGMFCNKFETPEEALIQGIEKSIELILK